MFQSFAGLKNTVNPERLTARELERALNIDLDDVGQAHRRRGFTKVDSADYHSIYSGDTHDPGTIYGVRAGVLGVINPNFTFTALQAGVGPSRVDYTQVGDITYFSSATTSGQISKANVVTPWGAVDDAGIWVSPVLNPTTTLGAISGKQLGAPPLATSIAACNGRIYLAHGRTLWATELYLYNYVDKTRTFIQFEDDIAFVKAVSDGLYVGTAGAVYFLQGPLAQMKMTTEIKSPAWPGSAVMAPAEIVHPRARDGQPYPMGPSVLFMTDDGMCAGFNSGEAYNLTRAQFLFPKASSAAALFRDQNGATTYVAVADSGGTPKANAQIGDFLDAEIVRFQGV